jgi:hypothetical protein
MSAQLRRFLLLFALLPDLRLVKKSPWYHQTHSLPRRNVFGPLLRHHGSASDQAWKVWDMHQRWKKVLRLLQHEHKSIHYTAEHTGKFGSSNSQRLK